MRFSGGTARTVDKTCRRKMKQSSFPALSKMQGEEAFQTSFQLSRQLFSLHHFGWAFLLAWVFCVFYTNELEGYIGSQSTAQANTIDLLTFFFYACLPLTASVIMLVIIVVCEKRLGSPSSHPKLFWIAPLSTSFATSLLFMNGGGPFIADLCFLVGSSLTGFGSALLWVLWGEYYARISREEGETLGPVSGVIAAILVLIVSSMSGWVAVAVVVFFPLLSGVCLMLSWHDVENEWPDEYLLSQDVQHTRDRHVRPLSRVSSVLKSLGRTGVGLFAACLFVSLAGGFWGFPSEDVLLGQIILLVSILFMVAISLVVTTGPRRISMSFLYRWMCPAIVVAFAAIIIGGGATGCELAEYYATLGVKTLLAERAPRLLPHEDPDVGAAMARHLSDDLKVMVLTGANVTAINQDDVSKYVIFESDHSEKMVRVDCIILATGSRPVDRYGLATAGVKFNKAGFIKTNTYFQTNVKHIYAIGDCANYDSSTARNEYQGRLVAHNFTDKTRSMPNYTGFPRTVNTLPAVVTFGAKETELKKAKKHHHKALIELSETPASKIYGTKLGFVKVITDYTGHIVAGSIFSDHAEEMSGELALAIRHRLTALELASTPHPAGSFNQALTLAAKKLVK